MSLRSVVTNSILDKMTFKKRPDRSERVSHRETWRRSIPGRGSSKHEGPETGLRWPPRETTERPVWLTSWQAFKRTFTFIPRGKAIGRRVI